MIETEEATKRLVVKSEQGEKAMGQEFEALAEEVIAGFQSKIKPWHSRSDLSAIVSEADDYFKGLADRLLKYGFKMDIFQMYPRISRDLTRYFNTHPSERNTKRFKREDI